MTQQSADELISEVFAAFLKLTDLLGRPISPDGHLVGGLGEAYAADKLGLELEPPSTKDFDARDSEGRTVQIKATTQGNVRLSGKTTMAERFVAVQLDDITGAGSILYVGPADVVWALVPKSLKRRQWSKSLKIIAALPENEWTVVQ